MKLKRFLVWVVLSPMLANAETLTLDQCRQMARENYPMVKQYGLIEQSRDFTLSNALKAWLPQVSVSGGAYAFTDVLDLPAQMSALGTDMKNYLLNASVTVNQTVYDGGTVAAQKKVARAQAEVEKVQTDVSVYALNERIEQLFFGILMLDEQTAQSLLLQKDLAVSRRTVESMQKGGMANQSDVDAIHVEQVKAKQNEESMTAVRSSYLRMLAVFIGKSLDKGTVLVKPALQGVKTWTEEGVARPEMELLSAQSGLVDAQRKQLDANLKPKLGAFGMGMSHSAVTSMAKNSMLMGGLSLSWNIGALYTRKNDIAKLENMRKQIDVQRETFLFNNHLEDENVNGNIQSLHQQIGRDEEIVALRESIRGKSEKKVQLGTESVNEMLRDINAVSEARQQKALHEVQLLKEIYHQKNINNN